MNKKIFVFLLASSVFALSCTDFKWYSFRGVDFGSTENYTYKGSYIQKGIWFWKDVEEAIGIKYEPIKDEKKRKVIEGAFAECRPDYIEISIGDLNTKRLGQVVTEQVVNVLKSQNKCSSGDSNSNCLKKNSSSTIDKNKFAQFSLSRKGSNLSYLSDDDTSCTNSPDNPDEGEMTQEKCELDPNREWYGRCYYKTVEVPEPEHEIIVLGKSPYWTESNPFMITNTKTYLFKFCPINGLIFRGFYLESTKHQFTQNGNTYETGEYYQYDVHYDSYLQSFNNFCPL